MKRYLFRIITLVCVKMMIPSFLFAGTVFNANAQKITLVYEQVELHKILEEVKRLTSYDFIYKPENIDGGKKVSLDIREENLEPALKKIFDPMGISMRIESQVIMLQKGQQEEISKRVLKGKVLDEDKNPLPGVNVFITGTTIGALTDMNGEFQIGVPGNVTSITFSFIGMKSVEYSLKEVDWSKPVKIIMKNEVATLDEVVVNGFDGKSTFTLVNRENPATSVKLTLATTSTAGVYEIVDAGGEEIDNISATVGTNNNAKALAGKKVKFTSLTTTNRDGFLNLAADEMKGIELVFSGANAAVGEKTYYGAFTYTTGSTPALDKYAPSLESAASYFDFEKAKNAAGKVDYIMNEVEYAYLDANGVVAAEKDTLYVASYKLKAAKDKYLKDDFAYDATGGEFIFKKNLNGTYAMLPVATAGSGVYGTEIAYNAQVVSVNATTPLAFAANVEYLYGNNAKSFSNVSFNYSSEATSLEAVPQHVLFDSSLGAISMQQSDKGFMEGIVSGKGTDADFTLWLDTADSKAAIPSFYISKGITKTKAEEAAETRLFLYNSVDSMSYWTEGSAVMTPDPDYVLAGTTATPKAIFRAAALNHPDRKSDHRGRL